MRHILSFKEKMILEDILSPLKEQKTFESVYSFEQFSINEGWLSKLIGNEVELKAGDEVEIKSDKSTFKGKFDYDQTNRSYFFDSNGNKWTLDQRSEDKLSSLSIGMEGTESGGIGDFAFRIGSKNPMFVGEKITEIRVNGKKIKTIVAKQFKEVKTDKSPIKKDELSDLMMDIMNRDDSDDNKKELIKIFKDIESKDSEEGETWSDKERERVNDFLKKIKPDSKPKTDHSSKIDDTSFDKILDKTKQYLNKGVLTSAILTTLVALPGLSNAQKSQLSDIGNDSGIEVNKETGKESDNKDNKKTINWKDVVKKIDNSIKSGAENIQNTVKLNIDEIQKRIDDEDFWGTKHAKELRDSVEIAKKNSTSFNDYNEALKSIKSTCEKSDNDIFFGEGKGSTEEEAIGNAIKDAKNKMDKSVSITILTVNKFVVKNTDGRPTYMVIITLLESTVNI